MTDPAVKKCPKCGQLLRFPKGIGGMLMACPNCGKKFYSDFKMRGGKQCGPKEFMNHIFEMPTTVIDKIIKYFGSSSR